MTKKEDKIRNRQSYKLFKEWFEFLKANPTESAILKKLFYLLNSRCAFGSETNANYAWESLELLIKDYVKRKIKTN